MNRTQHYSLLKAMEIDKKNLLKYQELYKYAYILSDGIFKIVFAEEKDHTLLISLVNTMLGLQGDDAIKDITLEMQEFPGVFNKKDCILDIIGTTNAGEKVLVKNRRSTSIMLTKCATEGNSSPRSRRFSWKSTSSLNSKRRASPRTIIRGHQRKPLTRRALVSEGSLNLKLLQQPNSLGRIGMGAEHDVRLRDPALEFHVVVEFLIRVDDVELRHVAATHGIETGVIRDFLQSRGKCPGVAAEFGAACIGHVFARARNR